MHGLPPNREQGHTAVKAPADFLDILNKLAAASTGLPSDAVCFGLLQAIFPSLFPHAPVRGHGAQKQTLHGSRARIPSMMGAMRELLVRHTRLDVGHHVRCLLHRIKVEAPDCELRSISHNQVSWPLFPSFIAVAADDQVVRFTAAIIKAAFGPSILGGEANLRILIGRES